MEKEKDLILEYIENEYKSTSYNKDNIEINKNDIFLSFGEGHYEDFIVGNEKGIKNLIKSCEKALEYGESSDIELGNLSYGIKKIEKTDNDSILNPEVSIWGNFLSLIIGILIVVPFFIGFITIIEWILDNF